MYGIHYITERKIDDLINAIKTVTAKKENPKICILDTKILTNIC